MFQKFLKKYVQVEPHVTVTIFTDEKAMIGLPRGTTPTQGRYVRHLLIEWLSGRDEVLVLPWPIDLVDKRVKS